MNFVKATVFRDHGINRFEASCPTMACAFSCCSALTQFDQDLSANTNDEQLEVSDMPTREKYLLPSLTHDGLLRQPCRFCFNR